VNKFQQWGEGLQSKDAGTHIGGRRGHSTRRRHDAEDESKERRSWFAGHGTIDAWFYRDFDESKVTRGAIGSGKGGQFQSKGEGGGGKTEEKPEGKRATNIQAKPGTRPPGRGAQQPAGGEGEKPEGEKKKATKAESPAKSIYDQQDKLVTKDEFYDPANGHLSREEVNTIADVKDQLAQGHKGKKGFDTQRTYKPGGTLEGREGHQVYKGGEYTAARKAKHDEILDKLFSDAKLKAAKPPEGGRPMFVMLGGRGGSGKSFFTEGDIKHGGKQGPIVDPEKHILIDSDWFKKELGMEGWDAAHYHEEASDLVDVALATARERGLNVIYDATMKSPGSADKNLTAFEGAGFDTTGYYMSTPLAVAARNSVDRFKTRDNDFSGRFVPPEYILDSQSNEETFDGLRHRFGDWAVYANKTGRDPQFYASKSKP
jgi:Zeta toxin